jgi:hypothetical protein
MIVRDSNSHLAGLRAKKTEMIVWTDGTVLIV